LSEEHGPSATPPLTGPYRCVDRESPTDVAEGLDDLARLDAAAVSTARLRPRYRGCSSHRRARRWRRLRRTVRCRGCLDSALGWNLDSAERPCTTPPRWSQRSRDCSPEATRGSPTGSGMRRSTR
jgi:hypothetical protein